MKQGFKRSSILIVILASLVFNAVAQQSLSGAPQDEIKQAREEIKKLEAIKPPPGMEARHRSYIEDRRIRLHALLQKKRDEMAAYIQSVEGVLAPAQVQELKQELETLKQEMDAVKSPLLGVAHTPTTPAPVVIPAPNPPANPAPPTVDRGGQTKTDVGKGTGTQGLTPVTPTPQKLDVTKASQAVAEAGKTATGATTLRECTAVNSSSQFSRFEQSVCDLVIKVQGRKRGRIDLTDPVFNEPPDPTATISLGGDVLELQAIFASKLFGREERGKFLLAAEEARTDKQVGGTAANSGSTSLVVKGSAPTVLGVAVENGALLQSTSGTTITFRANPIGLGRLLAGQGYDTSYENAQDNGVTDFLRKTSFGVSFDANRGREPGVFTADPQQISAFSTRIEFLNQRDPRHPKHKTAWQKFLAGAGTDLTNAIFQAYNSLTTPTTEAERSAGNTAPTKFKDPALEKWFQETKSLVAAAATDDVETVVKRQLEKFPVGDQLTAEARNAFSDFARSYAGYLTARQKLLDEIAKGSIISFEYVNHREPVTPDRSEFLFIAETGIAGGKADLTANGALTMFNSTPMPGMKRVRDFNFSGQLDVPFKIENLGSFVFSFAGRYQRQLENAMTKTGTVVPDTKGDIAVGQLKLMVPIKGSGFKIPISFSFANRTELIKEREVRANFGFTFDLDTLFAKLKPF